MRPTHLYKGQPVELLALTYTWKGTQFGTILMKNRLGVYQHQTVAVKQLTPLPGTTPEPRK